MSKALVHLHLQRFADLGPAAEARLQGRLTSEDQAGMVRHAASRQRQGLVRGLLRELLAEAAGMQPEDLQFIRDPQGKPSLANAALHFNISHTERACAIAWSREPLQLGVDIEDTARQFHEARLAEHAFSAGEIRAWQSAMHPRRRWLAIWTRKEALLKATGLGIRISLASIDTEKGEPPGTFTHTKLGSLQFRTWVASEQVFTLAWVSTPGLEVRVRLAGSLPGFEPTPD
jgi:4'-phosphopantetheinyl transferase